MRGKINRYRLKSITNIMALLSTPFIFDHAAFAQELDSTNSTLASDAGAFEDIVVTARRRAENLQNVPISITALSGDSIDRKNINTVRELQFNVPGVVATPLSPGGYVMGFGIRGQRSDNFLIQMDSPVAFYFADALQPRTMGFGHSLFDIESVQVLKGPQGTLFGRNTTGGAVSIEPRKPTPELDAMLGIGVGNYNRREAEGMINVPFGGSVSARIAGKIVRRDGYSTNIVNGEKWDDEHNEAFRASLLINPHDGFENLTILDYLHAYNRPGSTVLVDVNPASNTNLAALGLLAAYQQKLAEQRARSVRQFESNMGTGLPNDPFPGVAARTHIRNVGITNRTMFKVSDNLTFKNIFSFRDLNFDDTGQDVDGTGLLGVAALQHRPSHVISDEVQLLGNALENKLNWITGALFLREHGSEYAPSGAFGTPALPGGLSRSVSAGYGTNKSYALFAQGSYKLFPELTITGGIRYSWDTRIAANRGIEFTPPPSFSTPICSVRTDADITIRRPITDCELYGKESFGKLTWTVSLEYKPSPDMLVYATNRRGYRSGGFNQRTPTRTGFMFRPEIVDDFEAGIKSDWRLGGIPIRTNLALYHDVTKDMQRQFIGRLVSGISSISVTYTDNAPKVRTYGGELEISILPFPGFELSGYYTYTHARFAEPFTTRIPGFNTLVAALPKGRALQSFPDHQGSVTARYTLPLDETAGKLSLQISYFRQSKSFWSEVDPDVTTIPAYGLLNLRADWEQALGSNFDVALFMKNVSNKTYAVGSGSSFYSAPNPGWLMTSFGDPRTYGLSIRYNF